MDIKKMIEDQKELDKTIFEKGNITEYPLHETILGYKVEVGEALNEWEGFKYWKINKDINRDALLEELADCLHFALSLEGNFNEFRCNYQEYEGKKKWRYVEGGYGVEFYAKYCFRDSEYLGNTIALALSMGFTREELVNAYYRKRNINFERAKNGY